MMFVLYRDTSPNRSIALIKFRKADSAFEFAEAYNGKAFNSMNVSPCLPLVSLQLLTASPA
jgi:BRCA1-associated protein